MVQREYPDKTFADVGTKDVQYVDGPPASAIGTPGSGVTVPKRRPEFVEPAGPSRPVRGAGREASALAFSRGELGVVDHALRLEVGEAGELVGRRSAGCRPPAGCTAALRRVLGLGGLHRVLAHLVAAGDQVDEHAEVRQDDHEDRPRSPWRSRRGRGCGRCRAKTMISSQIQMKNRKNQSIDQKTWPVPKSASMTGAFPGALWV